MTRTRIAARAMCARVLACTVGTPMPASRVSPADAPAKPAGKQVVVKGTVVFSLGKVQHDVGGERASLYTFETYCRPGREGARRQARDPLHFANDQAVVRLLLSKGLGASTRNSLGLTPLHFLAVNAENSLRLEMEADYSAHVSILPYSALEFETGDKQAARKSDEVKSRACSEMLKPFLKAKADLNARDILGRTPLHYAAGCHDDLFVDVPGMDPRSRLMQHYITGRHTYATSFCKAATSALLSNGAKPNISDSFGKTPLLYASDLDTLKALIAKGADVNVRDKGGKTALHYASQAGDIDRMKLLLANGVKVNIRDKAGHTPLFYAPTTTDPDIAPSCIPASVLKRHGAAK